jgi:hypothetical protein
VTGGIGWDGAPANYRCPKEALELAQPGDKISAEFTSDPGVLVEGVLEAGVNAARVRPAPYKAPEVKPWNPNDTGDVPFRTPQGFPLDMDDVDRMLREQAKLIEGLTGRVVAQEALLKSHLRSCICGSGAANGFAK